MNYYEVLKALKGLPVTDYRTMLFARKIRKNYTKDVTVSGVPCVLEKSVGKPIISYKIYGNTVQDGTPTPENPVEVKGVGNKTDNVYEIPVVSRGKNLWNEEYPDLFSRITYMPVYVGEGTFTLSLTTPLNDKGATSLFFFSGKATEGE